MTEEKIEKTPETKPEAAETAQVDVAPESEAKETSEADAKSKKVTKKPKGKKKKGVLKPVATGRAYIQATYNNTLITITDQSGNTIAWSSAGINGFKGPKKATPYAAGVITRDVITKAKERGLKEVNVFVKGVGTGREAAIRALNANGINILSIKDVTPIPHNGCRPRKPRRV